MPVGPYGKRDANVSFEKYELRHFLNRELPFFQLHWNGMHVEEYYNGLKVNVDGEVRDWFFHSMVCDNESPTLIVLTAPNGHGTDQYVIIDTRCKTFDEMEDTTDDADRYEMVLEARQMILTLDEDHRLNTTLVISMLLS